VIPITNFLPTEDLRAAVSQLKVGSFGQQQANQQRTAIEHSSTDGIIGDGRGHAIEGKDHGGGQ
jgi:hypothetical protein